ncbi:NAD-dependent epimerase/dehydratase family protein [Sphaerotilaceae bacterium SBD11-9]
MDTSPHPLRVVLLGASGFIGSAVLRQLEGLAGECRVLVHRTRPPVLPEVAVAHSGSLTDLPAGLWPAAPHVVIHCASKQIDDDRSGFAINLQGIEHLCEQVTPCTRAVLFVSSCSVYGDGAQRGVTEDAPLRPATPLARSRAQCEARLARLAATGHCRVELFRPRFVLGQGDRHVLPGLARLARRGFTLGHAQQRFSVIDVDDFARILLARAQAALLAGPGCEVFNVGCLRPLALHEILQVLAGQIGVPPPRWRIPVHPLLLKALAWLPGRAAQGLLQRLRLMGLDHHLDVSRLHASLPAPGLALDPFAALTLSGKASP